MASLTLKTIALLLQFQDNRDGDEYGDACDSCPDSPGLDDDEDGFVPTIVS